MTPTTKNKYHIKIVPFDPVKYDLQQYHYIDEVSFTVGYLTYQDDKLIHTAWFKSYKSLFRALDEFLNNPSK